MDGKLTNGILRFLLPLLLIGMLFSIGCDELLDEEDTGSDYTAPPSQLLGKWHLFAGGVYEADEMVALDYLGIWVEVYVANDASTKFRMNVDGESYDGDVDWRASERNEYLVLIENGSDETELTVIARSDEIIQLRVPGDGDPDQLWVMAKGTFTSAGIVTDASTGLPIAGADVTITNQSEEVVASTLTSDLGLYLATDLEAAALRIEVSKSGYTTVSDWFAIEYERPVFVSFSMTASSGNEDGMVVGTITDSETGSPISGVTVTTQDLEHQDTSDSSGEYLLFLPPATYTLLAVMDGYETGTQTVTVTSGGTQTLDFELTPGTTGGEGTVTGLVTASQNGDPLEGVTISVTGVATTVTTDANGTYSITAPSGLQEIIAAFEGYYTISSGVVVVTDGSISQNFSLSPEISSGSGAMRLVLTWGESPSDLDSHLLTPEIEASEYHVYFGSRGDSLSAPYARLDVDDTSGFGPETITIYELMDGTYRYYIYNWSGTPGMAGSGAQVQMYSEEGLIQTVTAPATGEGNYWYICDIDGATGGVTLINEISVDQPTFSPGLAERKVR